MFASINQRMMFGVAASLLLHGLALFLITGISVAPRGKLNGSKLIAVQLVPQTPKKEKPAKAKDVMALHAPSEFKVSPPKFPQKETPRSESVTMALKEAAAQPPEGTSKGIAIPKAIFLPWAQGLQVRPPGTGAQPDNQRSWLSPQQQAEMRAQIKVVQLNESLGKIFLEQGGDVAGSCSPSRSKADQTLRMDCMPESLESLVVTEKPSMLETLEALRVAGKQVDKIFIIFRERQITISFHEHVQKPKTRP